MSFKDFIGRQAIWLYSFGIVTVLLVISLIIYGFDIKTPEGGTRKALTSQIKNSGKTDFFFKIDDKHTFQVYLYEEGGDVMHFGVSEYVRNYIPFCFVCGWNRIKGKDFSNPYQKGDLLYAAEPTQSEWDGIPEGVYPYLDLEEGAIKWVEDLEELGRNLDDPKYALDALEIENSYPELSVESSDDEDCMISIAAITLCYMILAVWLLIAGIVYVIRKPKSA